MKRGPWRLRDRRIWGAGGGGSIPQKSSISLSPKIFPLARNSRVVKYVHPTINFPQLGELRVKSLPAEQSLRPPAALASSYETNANPRASIIFLSSIKQRRPAAFSMGSLGQGRSAGHSQL